MGRRPRSTDLLPATHLLWEWTPSIIEDILEHHLTVRKAKITVLSSAFTTASQLPCPPTSAKAKASASLTKEEHGSSNEEDDEGSSEGSGEDYETASSSDDEEEADQCNNAKKDNHSSSGTSETDDSSAESDEEEEGGNRSDEMDENGKAMQVADWNDKLVVLTMVHWSGCLLYSLHPLLASNTRKPNHTLALGTGRMRYLRVCLHCGMA